MKSSKHFCCKDLPAISCQEDLRPHLNPPRGEDLGGVCFNLLEFQKLQHK